MSSETQATAPTQNRKNSSGQRGRGGNRNRRGNRGTLARNDGALSSQSTQAASPSTPDAAALNAKQIKDIGNENAVNPILEADEGDICFICAEPVKYYSVSECNHRTCHVCALRLRALYKKLECTFCKESQPSVIFTVSPDAPFSSFTPESIPQKDPKLSIYFETAEMMEETMILLRFNCPDPECDYIATGWGDLKLHVRGVHGKMMCDLCIRFKKVFSHEHALYAPNQLPLHLPSIPHRSYKSQQKEQIEGGTHPLCEFCRECFFSSDELFAHMRERHEECFICKRNEIRDQYFQNYESLEAHFNHAHHPCTQSQCLARKFVVFNSVLDLKAHMVEEHGTDMTSRDKKDARRIQADFEFEEVGIGSRRGRPHRAGREDPPNQTPINLTSGPYRPNGRRREAFGASLTTDSAASSNNITPEPSRVTTPSLPDDVDPVVAERYAAFMARLRNLAPNTSPAAVGAAIRGYRGSEINARDVISTIWNILDRNLDDTAGLVNTLVDLFEDEDKKRDLLTSWNGFKVEQRRQFPDLVPAAIGSGYAGITSGRLLNVKHSAASRSSHQSSRQVWDRVAQAASSSSSSVSPAPRPPDRFPPLYPSTLQAAGTTKQSQRNTPWASSTAPSTTHAIVSVPAPARTDRSGNAPPSLSKALFPELPPSAVARPKMQVRGDRSLKNILGETVPSTSAWGQSGQERTAVAPEVDVVQSEDVANQPAMGKIKKGKGKQKQTLFTLGSFPT